MTNKTESPKQGGQQKPLKTSPKQREYVDRYNTKKKKELEELKEKLAQIEALLTKP